MDFIDTVIGHPQNRQIDWLTIHPRTRSTPSSIPIRSEALEILAAKYAPILPILLSGDVFDVHSLPFKPSSTFPADLSTLTLNDILPGDTDNSNSAAHPSSPPADIPRPSNTHLSGFMSARGLLSNPALFAGHRTCPWEAVERFMCNVARAPIPFKLTLHHVYDMCSPGMGADKTALLSKKERVQLNTLGSMFELIDFLDEKMEERTGRGLRRDL